MAAAAIKAKIVDAEVAAKATQSMATLNAKSSQLMQEIGVHACTDVTGFGLIGHTVEMAQNSRICVNLSFSDVPLLPKVEDLAQQACSPGGAYRNNKFYSGAVTLSDRMPFYMQDILYDPQTSGGLLISLAPTKAKRLLQQLQQAGVEYATIIGEVVHGPKGTIILN